MKLIEKVGTIKINGKLWKYGWGDGRKYKNIPVDGLCDYNAKTIIISRKSTRSLEEVACHEVLHARFPDLTEESIFEVGEIVGEIVQKIKYELGPKPTRQ
jgi:hypothetical protein